MNLQTKLSILALIPVVIIMIGIIIAIVKAYLELGAGIYFVAAAVISCVLALISTILSQKS